MTNWMDMMQNPRGYAFKKAMFDFLKQKYGDNEPIIDRLACHLVTETDMKAFMKMMADIYETAYLKAVSDHKEQLAKLGLAARVVSPE